MRPVSVASRYTLIENVAEEESFAEAVAAGFARTPKAIPCRFLYDEAGSKLFEEICELPEYYLTRAEREILRARAASIAARFAELPLPSSTMLIGAPEPAAMRSARATRIPPSARGR